MADAGAEERTLDFTPTWVVAAVCCVIVLISFLVHRFLHFTGQLLSRPSKKHPSLCRGVRKHLFDALQKIKEELMLLGFISLLLSVFQTRIGQICISERLANVWLPCHQLAYSSSTTTTAHFLTNPIASGGYRGRRLLPDAADYCGQKGKVPLLSVTALHHLHILIFVLATFHVIFCVVIILCGEAKLHRLKQWDKSIIGNDGQYINEEARHSKLAQLAREDGCFWGKDNGLGLLYTFFKRVSHSVTKSKYIRIRLYFIKAHNLQSPDEDFQQYIMSSVQKDFDKVIGISWYLWLFVVLFLLLNISGWNTYFWMSFLPLILLQVVGMKLHQVITKRTKKIMEEFHLSASAAQPVEFSDEDFWFQKPQFVLYLIHIILFQNSFELAFFFFILFQYDFNSCIMGEVGYVVPRLVIGVCLHLICSYRTLPLYAIMKSQMSAKRDPSDKEKEMKVVTLIWHYIEKIKVVINSGSPHVGRREGLAAVEQAKPGEDQSEKEADVEAQDPTKPAYALDQRPEPPQARHRDQESVGAITCQVRTTRAFSKVMITPRSNSPKLYHSATFS